MRITHIAKNGIERFNCFCYHELPAANIKKVFVSVSLQNIEFIQIKININKLDNVKKYILYY